MVWPPHYPRRPIAVRAPLARLKLHKPLRRSGRQAGIGSAAQAATGSRTLICGWEEPFMVQSATKEAPRSATITDAAPVWPPVQGKAADSAAESAVVHCNMFRLTAL